MENAIDRSGSDRSACLEQLARTPVDELTYDAVLGAIHTCICERYGIRKGSELSFDRLAIESIRFSDESNSDLSDEALYARVGKYDCHQTTLLVKMKTLFTMYVERTLGIHVDDDDVTRAKRLDQYAELVYRALVERGDE